MLPKDILNLALIKMVNITKVTTSNKIIPPKSITSIHGTIQVVETNLTKITLVAVANIQEDTMPIMFQVINQQHQSMINTSQDQAHHKTHILTQIIINSLNNLKTLILEIIHHLFQILDSQHH